jgi:hypothetical protein
MSELDKQLKDWHAALESEFAASQCDSPSDIAGSLKARIQPHILELADNLVSIAKYSESDTARLSATKYAIQLVVPQVTLDDGDPLNALIKQLTSQNAPDTESQT